MATPTSKEGFEALAKAVREHGVGGDQRLLSGLRGAPRAGCGPYLIGDGVALSAALHPFSVTGPMGAADVSASSIQMGVMTTESGKVVVQWHDPDGKVMDGLKSSLQAAHVDVMSITGVGAMLSDPTEAVMSEFEVGAACGLPNDLRPGSLHWVRSERGEYPLPPEVWKWVGQGKWVHDGVTDFALCAYQAGWRYVGPAVMPGKPEEITVSPEMIEAGRKAYERDEGDWPEELPAVYRAMHALAPVELVSVNEERAMRERDAAITRLRSVERDLENLRACYRREIGGVKEAHDVRGQVLREAYEERDTAVRRCDALSVENAALHDRLAKFTAANVIPDTPKPLKHDPFNVPIRDPRRMGP